MQTSIQIKSRKFKSYLRDAARNIGNVPTKIPSPANIRLVRMHNIAATPNYVDDFVSFNEFRTSFVTLEFVN